ncbi:hypothetical protein BW31_01270 [Pantoea agglomerans]|jgi:hypothetical protein|nr:hypothetical protein BW31_01270 [Pantoea agglomerans]
MAGRIMKMTCLETKLTELSDQQADYIFPVQRNKMSLPCLPGAL